jgi:hypothetical protein
MAVQNGYLTDEELRDALKAQVLEALTELMGWSSGTFSFSERTQEASQVPTAHTLDTTMVMMEVVKRIDEWQASGIKPNMRFQKTSDPTRVDLPEGAWDVLGMLDGKRSTSSIAAELIDKYHPQAIVIEDVGGAGWELVRDVRKLPAQGHLPILVLSSEQQSGLLGRLRRPKATVLEKPFLEIEFQQAVTQLVGRSL